MNRIAEQADEWDRRIASEFLQCPGLQLTSRQAARLWALEHERVETILAGLVDRGLLVRTANGMFVRRGECPVTSPPDPHLS